MKRTQLSLTLAWASNVLKGQGLSLEQVLLTLIYEGKNHLAEVKYVLLSVGGKLLMIFII